MGTRELREKYDASNAKQAINRAIREELPGGNEALDGVEALHQRMRASGSADAGAGLDAMRAVVSAMEAEIRRRYDLPL